MFVDMIVDDSANVRDL